MYLSIDTSQRIDLRKVKAERVPCGDIWLYAGNGVGRIYMDDEAARNLVQQLTALLDPAKPERPLDAAGNEIDPRGYVFIDKSGDAWGWDRDPICPRAPGTSARRPFFTRTEAQNAGNRCAFDCVRVEVWTPECGVPPMPEKTS